MSKAKTYEAKTEELLLPVLRNINNILPQNSTEETETVVIEPIEVYDVEFVKEGSSFYLRVYIDKQGGVTIRDCETVSHALSDALDANDFIEDAYILEVSSPGLGRQLRKDRHLIKSLGVEVVIRTYKAVDKVKEFSGVLKSFDKEYLTIEAQGADITFARADISSVRLAFDF